MAIIRKKIENLKAGQDYILSVQARNSDLNTTNDPLAAIRFTVPRDSTVPADITNLELYASFQNVMFKFDFGQEEDISHYLYELYSQNDTSEQYLVTAGRNAANVFTIAVENSSQEAGSSANWRSYWGRVKAVDTSGNESDWTSLVQTDENTPLIDEQFIDSLTASKITAGTIGAHTITLNGANSILQSSNFSTGSTGWQIKGDGTAEFDSQYIRGDLNAGSVTIGTGTYNYWNKSGAENDFRVGDATKYIEWDNSAATLTIAGNLVGATGSFSGDISGSNGSFSGTLSGVGGSFSSNVTVGTDTNKITIASAGTAVNTKIYSGTGTYNNTNTGFYMDASGRFSLKDKFSWDGTFLTFGKLSTYDPNSNLQINGAIVTGGIIRTKDFDIDAQTATDVAVLQNDRLYLINKDASNPGRAKIQFQASSTSVAGEITSDAGGIEIGSTGLSGTPTYIVGANTASTAHFKWQAWGSTVLELKQASSSGSQAILDLKGSSSSYITAQKLRLKNEGSTTSLSINWDEDTGTGIYRYSPGTGYTGVALVASQVDVLRATTQSGANPTVYVNIGTTSGGGGVRYVLRNTSGELVEYTSNRIFKESIETFEDSGSIIDQLRPVSFVEAYRGEGEEDANFKQLRLGALQHGFIAEEVAEVFGGHFASFDQNFNPTGWRWPDMISLCIAEIKSLRSRVAELEAL